ncbi:RHS repeat-associated core domain-containing protein [Streptomyces sp. NBC_00038]|uniref:RHS repeat-associated core domain-containing protein n=1 Tax=Streptomyces sp. NBC_00038 TaxID=2903615 RepID=UPI0022516227|nr:RHS repeat-associated core domain-containing protein [Streptomyces sp. NBC_00038]MCX5557430.1 RHS repeat-associated core domain-containing protein [Streptomyces sp. NBC_00038]
MNQYASGSPRTGKAARGRRPWLRRIAAVAGFVMVPSLLTPVVFAADADPLGNPGLKAPRAAKVTPWTVKANEKSTEVVEKSAAADRAAAKRADQDQRRTVTWPESGIARLSLPASGRAKAEPGSLPLSLAAPKAVKGKKQPRTADAVRVEVLGQKATKKLGIKGVVLKVTGPKSGGRAQLDIDYSAFATAYGGDWAGRLQLLKFPECLLDTVDKGMCRTSQPLDSANDRGRELLSSTLAFKSTADSGETMVLALAAGTQSGAGDYKATPLAASSTWEAGGSSGTFTWSYPLRTPPAAAGPTPGLSISYDSGSVDGRTASTNNQGSQLGEGFDLTSSYVERKYGSCDDDGQTDKFDLCWKYDNASLVLNGKATELVKDDTTGEWHLKNDDASTVEHLTGAGNGDDDGEYWKVTTGDGTQYVFGKHKLPGWRSDNPATTDTVDPDPTTDSTWLAQVYGDDSSEPGYDKGTDFSGRSLVQAWRWNLDYVVDTRGNAMSYYYGKETNYYAKNGASTNSAYTRGGYLKRIEYGQRSDTIFTSVAPEKVTFGYAQRCTAADCTSLTESTRDNWPDVPYDAICASSTADCTGNNGPSFFTRYRLTTINTYAWDAAAATPAYAAVDTWTLNHLYLDPGDTGDSTDQALWLDGIKHTGKRGTDLVLDPVKFTHVFMPNRVDGPSDDILSLDKPRLRTVTSEAGAQTIVSYAEADCVYGQTMPKVDENIKNCYPVYWSPNGEETPILDWFQKYPVTAVSTTDPHGGSEDVQHSYQYSGGGAWHYNEDPFTPEKERTWSVWRGFGRVTHVTGDSNSAQLKTTTIYLRGMDGDRVLGSDGTTPDPDKRKSVSVTGIYADAHGDPDRYAGFTRESVTYNGATPVSATINTGWSKKTATQHKSYADIEAYFVRTGVQYAHANLTPTATAPTWRTRTTTTTYDDYGMAATVQDGGDNAVSGDEKCTRTWYARDDDKGINSLASRTRTVAKACATADSALDLPTDSTRAGDVISDTATIYDDTAAIAWSASQKPTKGQAVWAGRAKSYGSDDAPVWQKIATTTYDTLGRPRVVKDTNDQTIADTTYVPAAAGPLTSSSVTNVKGHKATAAVSFATGSVVKATDSNGKITETEYDSLGRVTSVWLPNRSKALGKTANHVYTYKVTNSAMSWVSTGTLKGDGSGYNTTYEFYDSLLRSRQVQSPSPVGGRLVSLTLYDDRGLAVSAQGDIWDDTSEPSGTPVQTEGSQTPIQTDTTYDGAGRATKTVTKNYNVTRWTTDATYTGDTVTTSAPAGGQATAVVTNALGQTTERREYASPKPTGTGYTTTNYTYTPSGRQESITGPDKAKWSYGYDLFGRQTTATDPDKGTSSTYYDALDRVDYTVDAANKKLLYGYDELNRKTGLWQTAKTDGNKLAAWTFDSLAKGQPDTTVRYDGGLTGDAYTQQVTAYDSLYQVTGSQLILPDNDDMVAAGVPNPLSFTTGYRLDGTISQTSQPAVGGLAAETVSFTYNATGQQLTSRGTTGYLQLAAFTPQGDLNQLQLGMDGALSAKKAYLNWEYEPGTRRLTHSFVTDDVHGYMPQDLKFTQDDAGNVTSILDASTQGGTAKPDYQCFTYDGSRRLTESWTPKTADCAATGRTTANIDGAAPYWTSYTYTGGGQRKTETKHTASGDNTTTYAYDATTDTKPHTLDKTTGATTGSYVYDATGNTTSRPGPSAQQALVWNAEGKPAKTTEGTKETSYLYGADGELLIRSAKGDGDTVLYLGGTEVRLTVKGATKTLSGTRYYSANGQTIAVRTATSGVSGTKLSFLASDHHGTSSIALDATTYAVTKRYTTPFGATRGTKATNWPDDKAFLGKPADESTALTHIGAREYDSGIGQFISVDPLLELDKHQTLNGYSYGAQNPVTNADPSGLGLACGGEGGDEGCGSGVVTHGDGSLSKDGNPTGGGVSSGGGGTTSGRGGTASTDSTSGDVIIFAEAPELGELPQQYRYQSPNGVCIYAMASSCDTVDAQAQSIPDLPCPSGEAGWVCAARNSLYKFGILSGMQGGSIGFFGLGGGGARWNQVVRLPEGLTRSQFSGVGDVFRSSLKIKANVVVQGSRVTGNITGSSDLDIAVRVSPETFDAMVAQRWVGAKPGSAKARTRDWAIETGKITAGDSIPKLSGIRNEIQGILGDEVHHVDVSVIKMGGAFDNGPFIGIE